MTINPILEASCLAALARWGRKLHPDPSYYPAAWPLWALLYINLFQLFDTVFVNVMGPWAVWDIEDPTDQALILYALRQSKLSQDELNQLQKDTHFDKKELQQWYKGEFTPYNHLRHNLLTKACSI